MTQTTQDKTTVRGPTKFLINGEWVEPVSGKYYDDVNPSTGATLAQVAEGGAEDIDRAVKAARAAFEGPWAKIHPGDRGRLLYKLGQLVRDNAEELAEIDALDAGKPITSSLRVDIPAAIDCFEYYAGWADKLHGETVPVRAPAFTYLVRQPLGVVGQIIPWNFPVMMAAWKLAPALACGNTTVLKPAEQSPLSALKLGELCLEAGLPPGVVNVTPSRRYDMVEKMLDDPRTRKLSFTGSTHVGRILLEQAARSIVKCSMELGGNGPFLVFADADLEAAVEGAMAAKMRNAGESCIAANRFYVEESVADEFGARLAEAMAKLRVGPGLDRQNDVGPLINTEARDEIAELVGASVATGAKLLTGGQVPEGPGSYYEPTVLTSVDPNDAILDEEIFGPVAPVVSFATEAEAIEMANRTEYGLAAYVYSADLARALRVSEAIDTGMVGINRGFISDPAAPFGGTKQSGLGREGGHEGLMEFLEQKYLAVDWSEPA